MPIINNLTPNRSYKEPFGTNSIKDDVLRLIDALRAIDHDMADTIAAVVLKAPLLSPAFTGSPTAPTPADADNSGKIATTSWVRGYLDNLAGTAPETLDTITEIAAALQNNPDVIDDLLTAVGGKLAKDQNLDDLSDKAAARDNLDVYAKGEVDTEFDAIAAAQAAFATALAGKADAEHSHPLEFALIWMELARAAGSGSGFINGWSDSYQTYATLNAANSTNEDVAEIGVIRPTSVTAAVGGGVGTLIQTPAPDYGGSAAFDNNTSQTDSYSAYWGSSEVVALGKQWPAAKTISRVVVHGSTNNGYGASGPKTLTLRGKNSAFSGPLDGTVLGSISFDGGTDESVGRTITASLLGAYTRHIVTLEGSNGFSLIAEIKFHEKIGTDNADIRFNGQDIGAVPATADLYAVVEETDALTLGTDFLVYATRDNGANWTAGTATRVGTVGGLTILQALGIDLTGQPSGQSLAPRFASANNKNFKLHAHTIVGR